MRAAWFLFLLGLASCGTQTAVVAEPQTPAPAPAPSPGPSASASLEQDCKLIEPEFIQVTRMIEVMREADPEADPHTLGMIADRLLHWSQKVELKLFDPEMQKAAKSFREAYKRTEPEVREMQAAVEKKQINAALSLQAKVKEEHKKDEQILNGILRRCPMDPYAPYRDRGKIPFRTVQQTVQSSFDQIQACYLNRLKTQPKLRGQMTVHMIVSKDGSVIYAGDADYPEPDSPPVLALPALGKQPFVVSGPPLPSPEVRACVVKAFKSLKFPPPGTGNALVIYPMNFEPLGSGK